VPAIGQTVDTIGYGRSMAIFMISTFGPSTASGLVTAMAALSRGTACASSPAASANTAAASIQSRQFSTEAG